VSNPSHHASTSLRHADLFASSEPPGGVFDLAVVGMALVTRLTHRFHRLNPALQTLLGRTEPALLGYPLATVVHDDDRANVGALLRLSDARTRPSSSAEARLIRDDGSHLRVTLTVTPAPATDSGLEFLLCQVSDVDEQRRVERDLRLADRLLATALEATTDAVYMKEAGGRYLMLNPAAAAYFGCPANEVVGHADNEFLVPQEAAALMAVDRRVLASGVTTTTEEVMSTDEGIRCFQSTKGVYRDDAGRPAGIFGISRDVTEQRRADDEHRRFEEALELTVEGVAHLDPEGRFIWVNDAFARLCGYPPLEMIGLPWSALAHPDDLDHMSAAHAGVAKGKRIEREVRTVRRDGSWFYAQLVVVMAKDGDGAHSGFYSTLRDVSDRKAAEAVLHRASMELERRNAELEGFAAMVAHDLRQPLQVVGGFAQLLAERSVGSTDEPAERYLAAIERGVGKMTAMVDSMLEYARAGEAEAPASLTDSHQIVADVIDGLEGSMNGGQVVVRGRLPVLPADPAELSRLFENLIGNALKFRAETAPVVQVAAEREDNAWRFTVQDDGMGVSPEFAEQLFGMFARERRSDCPGTGMGLAICRKIVDHHCGRIWFDAAPEGGSIFSFTLPAGPSAATA
jgi:PAS domain S-box-containing protein